MLFPLGEQVGEPCGSYLSSSSAQSLWHLPTDRHAKLFPRSVSWQQDRR